jgi:hypothetical protein
MEVYSVYYATEVQLNLTPNPSPNSRRGEIKHSFIGVRF